MIDIFRDALIGQLLRLLFHPKALRYAEECDANVYTRFLEKDSKDAATPLKREASAKTTQSLLANDLDGYNDLTVTAQVTRASRIRSRATNELDFEDSNVSESPAERAIAQCRQEQKLVGWSGPDDQDNPQNWSRQKKLIVSAEICYMTFAVYVGAGIYTASIPGIVEHFHVSPVAATVGLTCFVAGYGSGPMIWAPIGEVPQIGRAIVYLVCLTVFVCFQLGVILADNIGMLLAFRFLTGFFGSPVLATGGATMLDMWSPAIVSCAVCVWGVVAVLGPTLGPLLGGFAAMANGWRWPMWILMWTSGLSLAISVFFLPETAGSTTLSRRAARIRKMTGDRSYRTVAEVQMTEISNKTLAFEVLVRPFQLAFTEPVIFVVNMYVALIYGILYLYFEAFPIIFIEIYGFNLGEQGLAWLGLCVGSFVATAVYCFWIIKVRNRRITPQGLKPEEELPPAMVGGVMLTAAMFWFAWVSRPSIHWIVPIVASAFFSIGAGLLVVSIICYIMAAYPLFAASALASNDFTRSMLAAAFPLFGAATFHNLGIDWGVSMLAFLTAVFIPAPFIFYRYGGRLRKMSKRANHEMID